MLVVARAGDLHTFGDQSVRNRVFSVRETHREEKHRKNWVFPYTGRKQLFFLAKYTATRVRVSGFRSDSALHQQWCVLVQVI